MKTLPIISTPPALHLSKTSAEEISKAGSSFGNILANTIDKVNQTDLQGDLAIENLNTGKAESLHEVMIAVEEADMAIRMLVQMRNKALEAYNEIMRLQI